MWVVDSTVIVMVYDGHHGVWHGQLILHILKAGPVVVRYKQVTGGGARGVATAWQGNDDLWPCPRPVDDHLGVAVIQLNLEKKNPPLYCNQTFTCQQEIFATFTVFLLWMILYSPKVSRSVILFFRWSISWFKRISCWFKKLVADNQFISGKSQNKVVGNYCWFIVNHTQIFYLYFSIRNFT